MTRMVPPVLHGRLALPHLTSPYKGEEKGVPFCSEWRNHTVARLPLGSFFLPTGRFRNRRGLFRIIDSSPGSPFFFGDLRAS